MPELKLQDLYPRTQSVLARWESQGSKPASDFAALKLSYVVMEALESAYHAGVEDALKAVYLARD